jgi:3-methyladenine DNA glycosylase/8-oxoguanine DNA glycosylase
VAVETTIEPRRPYSLAQSLHHRTDPTHAFRNGILSVVFEVDGAPVAARVRQRGDGTLEARIDGPQAAVEPLRFMLAADDDHTPFLAEFQDDPLIGSAVRSRRGLRPLRTATVTHALLKAVCGQLIQASAARRLERRLLGVTTAEHDGLRLPPARATFGDLAPAGLARYGLPSRKATTLVRLSREFDLERLRGASSAAATSRLQRERGLGPWSAGVIALYGLGRYDQGLVGDLGLVKLSSRLSGAPATAEDTRALLEPYGEWAGLASVYLLGAV